MCVNRFISLEYLLLVSLLPLRFTLLVLNTGLCRRITVAVLSGVISDDKRRELGQMAVNLINDR